jgi:hypothetical protein
MPQGPHLLFDKSSLESLSVDESVLLDNFYTCNITPVFFVECLADLEKNIVRSRSTPEQLVGSLATRTPDTQAAANVFHLDILKAELMGNFDLRTIVHRPLMKSGEYVQLGDSRGMVYRMSKEEEALRRWIAREFMDVERSVAKEWRRNISAIDLSAMSQNVLDKLGPWRKPASLQDARPLTDIIIDNLDSEWILRFGLELLRVPEPIEWVVADWIAKRRPALRERYRYFIFMLSINIFFCLVLRTTLLRNVKPSHQIDLAYLYYLPFCSVFTSKDNFHVQVAPLFLAPSQTFVNGIDLKEDLKRLHELYSQLPPEERKRGLYKFAPHPPDDDTFLTTRLWNKYLPYWKVKENQPVELDPELQKALVEMVTVMKDSKPAPDGKPSTDDLDYVTVSRNVPVFKGSYQRFPDEAIEDLATGRTKLEHKWVAGEKSSTE